MKLGFEKTDFKFRILTKKMVRIEETIKEMKEALRRPEPDELKEAEAPQLEDKPSGEEENADEEKVADNTTSPDTV